MEKPANAAGGGGLHGEALLGGKHPHGSLIPRPPQHFPVRLPGEMPDAATTGALVAAVRSTLQGRTAVDQARTLRWLVGRSLLGIAKLQGFDMAAEAAYQHADMLAGAVR